MGRRSKGEGSIIKLSDGRFEARIELPSVDGKRRTKGLYGDTEAEVVQRLIKVRAELQGGKLLPSEQLTVGAYLTDWLQTVKPRLRPHTYAGYEVNVRVHIIPALGRIRLARLTPMQVAKFIEAKRAEGKAPRTVQYILAVLRSALGDALSEDKVARNAATAVRGQAAASKYVEPLSVEEAGKFLDSIRGDRFECLFICAITLGMRQGELFGLRWQDFDADAGTLSVAQTVQRGPLDQRFGAPKTRRSRRTLTLPTVTLEAIRAQKTSQKVDRMLAGSRWVDNDLIFATGIGTSLDSRNVTRHFQAILAENKIRRQTFKDLRHAAASFYLAKGADLRTVMDILGHSSIQVTANTYAHVLPSLKRDAGNSMDSLFGSRTG